jgi:hypothetical protein
LARGEVIEEFSWDYGGKVCGDFSLAANLSGGLDWRGHVDLNREFWGRCVAVADSGSILSGEWD